MSRLEAEALRAAYHDAENPWNRTQPAPYEIPTVFYLLGPVAAWQTFTGILGLKWALTDKASVGWPFTFQGLGIAAVIAAAFLYSIYAHKRSQR